MTHRSTILSEICCGFPQSLQENAGKYLTSGPDDLLLQPFQFIIRKSFDSVQSELLTLTCCKLWGPVTARSPSLCLFFRFIFPDTGNTKL
jgi:hypothetical protein